MNKTMLVAFVSALVGVTAGMLVHATPASADAPFNPDCHLEGINAGLDGVIAQIKSSPALGSAGGHYKRAVDDIQRVKNQLHDGCRYWNDHKG